MMWLGQRLAVGVSVAGLLASGEHSTPVTASQERLKTARFRQASAQQPILKLCPVGGERYPEDTQDCPIHHVPLADLVLARLRVEERSNDD